MSDPARAAALVIALLAMLVGLLGTVLPVLPGPVLIFAAALAYAVVDGFQAIQWPGLAVIGVLALLATGVEFLASSLGARARGAGPWSIAAGMVGGLFGTLLFALPGGILCALLCVLLAEFLRLREWKPAVRSSAGWLLGWLLSSLVRLAIATVMIAAFVLQVF